MDIDSLEVGDSLTFQFRDKEHTVTATGFRMGSAENRIGVICTFDGWKNFVVQPREIISYEHSTANDST